MALRFDDIHAGYRRDRGVLVGVSGGLPAGRITAIVGPNGAGKSTLLRVLAGVQRPASGRITLDPGHVADGDPIDLLKAKPRDRAVRLATIPQTGGPAFDYRVREIVALGRHAPGGAQSSPIVAEAIERVGLSDRADRRFGELSVGQRQRVAIARALAQLASVGDEPWADLAGKALLGDEPVAALDPAWAVGVLRLFRDLADAGAVVGVVLHDLTAAATWADDAIVLDQNGMIASAGPAREALTGDRLGAIFGCPFLDREADGVRVLTPLSPSPVD